VRDEAEIRGHRRTYVGALPGKLIQGMKKAGTVNPVFLLDEVDKMSSDFRGDPAAALLEALDPEQNRAFNDHYIEVDYDLSRALFITTANTTDGIPLPCKTAWRSSACPATRRMKTRDRPAVPRAQATRSPRPFARRRAAGPGRDRGDHPALHARGGRALARTPDRDHLPQDRARMRGKPQAGRGRRRRSQTPPPRRARRRLPGEGQSLVDTARVRRLLGPPPFSEPQLERAPEVGLSLGLAWTEVGGEILPVETTVMKGKGALTLTGNLGEVLQESAKAALTFLRAHAAQYAIRESFHRDSDLHVHIAEGAIPKDGPSAGVALAVSMASALSGFPVRQDLAMTGEITLRGKVLRIGGLKEKPWPPTAITCGAS
jgi:ATP-dependent Lon protease